MREPRLCAQCERAYAECPQCARCVECCGCEIEAQARLFELRDREAIREKASIALELARARGEAEVEAKCRELNDPAVFWAYLARTRPVLTYEACVEYVKRLAGCGAQGPLFDRG